MCEALRLAALAGIIGALPLGCASTPKPAADKPTSEQGTAAAPAAEGSQATPSADAAASRKAELVEKANAALDAALEAKALDVRGEALEALGASGRADALEKLTAALKAEQGEVRHAAARGLFYLRDPGAGEALLKAFAKEKGWSVKKELARAAGACRATALVPDLKKALADPNAELQAAAAFALQDLGDPEGAQALARLGNPQRKGELKEGVDRWSRKVLAGDKEGDKALAARTLARVGVAEDVAIVAPYLDSAEAPLRVWAAAASLRLAGR